MNYPRKQRGLDRNLFSIRRKRLGTDPEEIRGIIAPKTGKTKLWRLDEAGLRTSSQLLSNMDGKVQTLMDA